MYSAPGAGGSSGEYAAPGANASPHALHFPGAMRPADVPAVPAVDDRAVQPETGTEMIHGEIRRVMPAEPPHADQQCDIAYVIRAAVASGYVATTEMLTRVDHESDFATDACIRKAGDDPATGTRYLEEIAFEVKHTQSNADITERARKLVRRGVRRVFVIPVKKRKDGSVAAGPVKEWLAGEDRWLDLAPQADIEDRCLVLPIKAKALIDATEANDEVARALVAKENPVIVAYKQKALDAQAKALGKAHARELRAREAEHARELRARDAENARATILDLCDVLAIEVTSERRAGMDAMGREELDALRSTIRTRRCWPEEQ
jgi:hypothetical protein